MGGAGSTADGASMVVTNAEGVGFNRVRACARHIPLIATRAAFNGPGTEALQHSTCLLPAVNVTLGNPVPQLLVFVQVGAVRGVLLNRA